MSCSLLFAGGYWVPTEFAVYINYCAVHHVEKVMMAGDLVRER